MNGERSQQLHERGRSFTRSLTAWLSLAAFVVTAWLGVSLLFIHTGQARQGAALLPPTTCSDGHHARRPALILGGASVNILYSLTGCNAQAHGSASLISSEVSAVQTQLGAFGFNTPPEPIELEVLNAPVAGAVQTFLSPSGGRGALIIDGGANLGLNTLRGYAQLALGYALPGLSGPARSRLGTAFAVLAGGVSIFEEVQSELAGGNLTGGNQGLYDAWLTARFGGSLLRTALAGCQQACSWPAQLEDALHKRGLSVNTLEAQFASQAVGVSQRGQLVALLRQS